MRISTANQYDATIDNIQRRQLGMSEAQTRLTSGKRVLRASDDPAAAARAERALATELRSTTSQRSAEASRVLASQSESALGDAQELLQQAREAMVAAGNASYTDAERGIQADKLKGLREALLAVANRSDGSGSFLFFHVGVVKALWDPISRPSSTVRHLPACSSAASPDRP